MKFAYRNRMTEAPSKEEALKKICASSAIQRVRNDARYARLFTDYRAQNELLLFALCLLKGDRAGRLLKTISPYAVKRLLTRYPAYGPRLSPEVKKAISKKELLKKLLVPALLVGLLANKDKKSIPENSRDIKHGTGLLTPEEMMQFEKNRQANLPWNKGKKK